MSQMCRSNSNGHVRAILQKVLQDFILLWRSWEVPNQQAAKTSEGRLHEQGSIQYTDWWAIVAGESYRVSIRMEMSKVRGYHADEW